MKASPGSGTPPLSFPPCQRSTDKIEGLFARAMGWNKRTLSACAVLAAVLWSGFALAADPVERAFLFLAEARYSEARQVLDPLLKREPNVPRVRLLHGILLVREGNAAEAIAVFESLRSDHPDMFEPHNNLGVLYADQGRLDDAREALIAALEQRPDAAAYTNLGNVYTRLAARAHVLASEIGTGGGASSKRGGKDDVVSEIPAQPGGPSAVQTTKDGPGASMTEPGEIAWAAESELAAAVPEEPATQEKFSTAAEALAGPGASVAEPEESERAAESGSASAMASASGGVCVQAGKFKNRTAAVKAAKWMRSRGAEIIKMRHEKHRVVRSYRVFFPAFSSYEAAAAKLRELRGRGIRDVAIIGKGVQAKEISLGVYKNKSNMRRRVAELKKLGYSVMSAANTMIQSEYVIKARAVDARSAFDRDWTSRFPGHLLRYAACTEPS